MGQWWTGGANIQSSDQSLFTLSPRQWLGLLLVYFKLHFFLYFGFRDSCRSPLRRRYGTSILLQVMVRKLLDQPRDSPSRKKLAGELGHLTVTIYRKTETEVLCDEVGATTPSRVGSLPLLSSQIVVFIFRPIRPPKCSRPKGPMQSWVVPGTDRRLLVRATRWGCTGCW